MDKELQELVLTERIIEDQVTGEQQVIYTSDIVCKYITFELVERKPKTTVWLVSNNKSRGVLGKIEWYSNWRQYVFIPKGSTVFNNSCLNDIKIFLDNLNMKQQYPLEVE